MEKKQVVLPGRCYWIKEGSFLAGGYPYNPGIDEPLEFLRSLLEAGITIFIDLTEEDELVHYDQILQKLTEKNVFYHRFPVEDYSIPTNKTMNDIIEIINQYLQNKQSIYLHCRGGIGRTGTAVACWLKKQGMTGEEALTKLAALFKFSNAANYTKSPETEEQINFVLNFD